jgi:hypothetical protein
VVLRPTSQISLKTLFDHSLFLLINGRAVMVLLRLTLSLNRTDTALSRGTAG